MSVSLRNNDILFGDGTAQSTASFKPTSVIVQIGSSQTWTVPAGVTQLKVTTIGGAGGGGAGGVQNFGYGTNYYTGGSGGNGGVAVKLATVTPGTVYTIIIGSAGSGGYYYGGNNATAGGETWFGVDSSNKLVSSTGGGAGLQSQTSNGSSGASGTAVNWGVTASQAGFFPTATVRSSQGSSSASPVAFTEAGTRSAGFGGGGGGAYGNGAGGVGGAVIIEYIV